VPAAVALGPIIFALSHPWNVESLAEMGTERLHHRRELDCAAKPDGGIGSRGATVSMRFPASDHDGRQV
jgi:hypothetical protein